jgi:cytochrome c peroxidase
MDGLPRAIGADGNLRLRNTPTIFNVGLNSTYNWDGSADTLEKQAEITLSNPTLMNMTWPELLARLRSDSTYVAAFTEAYSEGLTQDAVLDAIASFERSVLTPNSRFDRYLRGERDALTERELAGYRLFKSYGCVSCHQGVNIGGNLFQKFGVFLNMSESARTDDPGRIAVTGVARDREVFRVPSLRNVAVTAPYFHDGRRVQVVQIRTNRLKGRLVSSSRSNVLRGTQARRVFRRAMPS